MIAGVMAGVGTLMLARELRSDLSRPSQTALLAMGASAALTILVAVVGLFLA